MRAAIRYFAFGSKSLESSEANGVDRSNGLPRAVLRDDIGRVADQYRAGLKGSS